MERLTFKNEEGEMTLYAKDWGKAIDKLAEYEDAEEQGRLMISDHKIGDKMYTDRDYDELKERLNTYEEMLYNKELIILPCKIGDEVYCLTDYYGCIKSMRGIVSEMCFTKNMKLFIVVKSRWGGIFGDTVFITRTDAETRAKQLNAKYGRDKNGTANKETEKR